MSGSLDDGDGIEERCDACAQETPHVVRIELRTESEDSNNAAYSREPYRVATCGFCGRTSSQRMNNA